MSKSAKILFFANTDWYLFNFRLSLALAVKSAGWDVVLVSPAGEYSERFESFGLRWIPFEFATDSLNPFKELSTIFRLIRLIKNEQPTLIHNFTIKCNLYGSLAAKLCHRVPVVNAVTGVGHIFTDQGFRARCLRPLVKLLYRFAFSQHCCVVFQNEADRQGFHESRLVNERQTALIRGSGVDCTLYRPRKRSDTEDANRPAKLLFASRLLREKGVYELLDAIRGLKGRGVCFETWFAGDIYPANPSSLTPEEMQRIVDEGLITYLGHVDDMASLIDACDIVVLPSYQEGTPRILIEAAAMEKPIVATDIPGCRGLVRNGVNGFLVEPKKVEPLADAIERLIADKKTRAALGRAGRRIVIEGFGEESVIQRTMELYQKAVEPQASFFDLEEDVSQSIG